MVGISKTRISISQIFAEVTTPESGGIDIFIGTVRNHSEEKSVRRLEYTAYLPMAEKLMGEIEAEVKRKWSVHRVALFHRIGLLEIGDIAVVTAVSSAHREEAFEACRYAIERVKTIVPIWKKEYGEDGESWVEGQHEFVIKPSS